MLHFDNNGTVHFGIANVVLVCNHCINVGVEEVEVVIETVLGFAITDDSVVCVHCVFFDHAVSIARIAAFCKRSCATLPTVHPPRAVVRSYYLPLYLHPLNLLYLEIRFVGHNVIDAIIHVDAIFHSNKLKILRLLVLEDNGECHCARNV